jgi:diguanylate cyclase
MPMPGTMDGDLDGEVTLERTARPLLELIERLTGLETTFVTEIDWVGQRQEVVIARNRGEIEVAEGAVVDWQDSMCRLAFLDGKRSSCDVQGDWPDSIGATVVGMRTFFAVPIVHGETTIGTVCGASARRVQLSEEDLDRMALLAEALSHHVLLHRTARQHLERAREAEALALTDSLTGLANRRAFTTALEAELARSARYRTPVSVLVIDIDRFKAVNDDHGHDAGDAVLGLLADVLRRECRTEDLPARLGGDEFVALLPQCDGDRAAAVAARIADGFREASAAADLPATVSIGWSSSDRGDRHSLLAEADAAMYRTKGGRRVLQAGWQRSQA